MRLIFITDTLSSGGAERVVSILANYFVVKRPTEIICLRKLDAFYTIKPEVKLSYADDYSKGWLGKMLWLRHYIKEDDILLPFMVKVYCVTLLSLLGKKVQVIASERNDPKTTDQPWKFLRPLLLPKASILVVQTQQIKNFFSNRIKAKIEIILNPLDLRNCYQGDWNPDSKVVLAVGRTDQQKNYPMMIRAFKKVHEAHPEFKLEIWGSRSISEDGDTIINLIKDIDATNYISIHGRTDNMSDLYGKAYMFVMSSNYEGLSNALIEALSSGLPCVSTKVSGATDIIKNGENGLLVDVGDENGFCQAILRLVENPDEAGALAINAQKCRQMFSRDNICGQWEGLIDRTVKNR